MSNVTDADVLRIVGPLGDFLLTEIRRTGASNADLQGAMTFVASAAMRDPRAHQALTPRLRRLVDLLGVADHAAANAA